jgi:hypothetical protein
MFMHIKFTCAHKLNIYNVCCKSYTKTHSKLASRREDAFVALALLRLLAGLLLPSVLLLLPFSIDIMSQCGIVRLHLLILKFFLDISYFIV